MAILAIDTATLVSSVALANRDKLLAEITVQTGKNHSEQLMPHIEQLLALAGMGRATIEAIGVSLGPGSFTGLRIGLATAKALAYALHVPLVGVPTLEALAFGCPVPGALLASTMDAQKGNLYMGLYRWQGQNLAEVAPPTVVEHQVALAGLAARPEPVIVLGEATWLFRDEISEHEGLQLARPHVAMPRAANVAFLGWELLDKGVRHDLMVLEPIYIRRSEAEVLWECRQGGST